jgi:serine protease Do
VIKGYDSVTVATYDNETYDAQVIGYDESNDIAVLKIEAENLHPVTMGDSDTIRVGEQVYAIGNPLGELTFSLTGGIISAMSRNIMTETGTSMSLIQTDCAINSGNSGGALFNLYGEVVGITNAKYSTSVFSGQASIDNIGFAIPIDSVLDLVADIIERG